ncbi:MAG: tRNA (guanosine(46)-N7)-methyltransferase TrmB [Planctomycetota bacterium]
MPTSLSSNQPLDVSGFGWTRDELPESDGGPMPPDGLRRWFGLPDGLARPLDLEIGSGKGTFLVQHAPREPGTDFLGIEIAKAFWRHAADRARRHGVANARLLWHDAPTFLRTHVADATFRRVHIYFPDPWPKARHHKRRLIQPPFLRELHRVLRPAGEAAGDPPVVPEVRLATDHTEYFTWMEEAAGVAVGEGLFERLEFVPLASAGPGELVGTNFERKYRPEGRRFRGLVLRKR